MLLAACTAITSGTLFLLTVEFLFVFNLLLATHTELMYIAITHIDIFI